MFFAAAAGLVSRFAAAYSTSICFSLNGTGVNLAAA
jgi:hypothetical protein